MEIGRGGHQVPASEAKYQADPKCSSCSRPAAMQHVGMFFCCSAKAGFHDLARASKCHTHLSGLQDVSRSLRSPGGVPRNPGPGHSGRAANHRGPRADPAPSTLNALHQTRRTIHLGSIIWGQYTYKCHTPRTGCALFPGVRTIAAPGLARALAAMIEAFSTEGCREGNGIP